MDEDCQTEEVVSPIGQPLLLLSESMKNSTLIDGFVENQKCLVFDYFSDLIQVKFSSIFLEYFV